jgi:hypothetical protein
MDDMRSKLKMWWTSFKSQIVQEVPRDLDFCQFECHRAQCTLELTGSCDIRPQQGLLPQQSLVLIRPALAAAANVCASQLDPAAACDCVVPANVA